MLYSLGLLGIAVAWILPGHYLPWSSFQQDVLATAGTALVVLGAVLSERAWPVRMPWIAFGVTALALVPLAQWAFGFLLYRLDAVMSAGYLVAFALAILAGRQLTDERGQFVLVLWGVIWAAAIASLGIALVQWLQIGPFGFIEAIPRLERISGNLRQPNQLASLFGIALAATLGAYETRRIGAWGAGIAAASFGSGIVMTQSRAGWMFVVLVVLLWALLRGRAALRTPAAAIVAGVAGFTGAVLAWSPLNAWLQSGVHVESVASRVTPGYRLLHWQTLWDALLQSPWVGYGWLQVPKAQLTATLDHPATFQFINASHNQFLDLLLWNGLPLGLLVIAGITYWAVVRLRQCRDGRTWSLWLALSFLCAHSLVEFPLQYAYFLLPAGLMVGAIEAAAPTSAVQGLRLRGSRWIVLTALVAMSGLLTVIVIEYGKLEETVRRVRLAEVGYVQPGGEPYVPDIELLDWQREYVRFHLTAPHTGMQPAQLRWMQDITTRYPTPFALGRLARAQALNGQPARAEHSLRLLCHISLERHCDANRKSWAIQAQTDAPMRQVRFPPTPPR